MEPSGRRLTTTLIAVDVGNSQIKLGLFAGPSPAALPEPTYTLRLDGGAASCHRISPWLDEAGTPAAAWWIGSVNRPAATRLIDWLRDHRPDDAIVLVGARDVPLAVRLPRPDMVGIDRLLDALAANRLREPGRAAVVVDVGSAVTVDLVSPDGAFCGGAILPGITMSARALHEFTDLLPLLDMNDLSVPPEPLGTATVPAMKAGLFWGTVGAIRELSARMGEGLARPPQFFLTGGAGPAVAALLGADATHVPHLTLAGIALAQHAAT